MTSVGATQGINETAANFGFGAYPSGGFSNIFARPSYQTLAVSSYLSFLGDTYEGLYNATGRGFPDVSSQGANFMIILYTVPWFIDGTSAASPTFASVIALLNDELVAAGKSTLGFINPLLYGAPLGTLNDITTGS